MFALVLTVLIVVAAMAVDLGQARFSKRDDQSAVDLAALDAGYYLAGKANPGVAEPAKACTAAVQSAQRNVAELTAIPASTISSRCGTMPVTAATCVAASPTEASFTTANHVLRVRYPVPVSELDSSRFIGGGLVDGADGCKRMRVTLEKTDDTRLAGVIGITELNTTASAVIRAVTPATSYQAPAMIVLERTKCDTLGTSAGGSGSQGIIVERNGSDPGIIHSDSNASESCSGSSQGAYAIYGSPLPDGSPAITAEAVPGPDGRPGVIEARATNGKGGATFPGGLNVAPTVGGIVSRKPVDDRYNSGTNTAIRDLHAAAYSQISASNVPSGYTEIECDDPVPPLATKLFLECGSFNETRTFTGVTHVIFEDNVNIKNNNIVNFPNATDITIRGKFDIPQGSVFMPAVRNLYVGDGVKVDGGSKLAVNNTTEANCTGRQPPAVWPNTTRVAVFGGGPAFDISGNVALCQTTVYLAGPDNRPTYSAQQVTVGGTCTAALPCPRTSGNAVGDKARFAFGLGTTIWSAPNQHPTDSPTTPGLEDIAMWTEGDGLSEIKSGATVLVTGIFFGPNTEFELRSPASGVSRDAQFWARRLFLYQGTLRLKPVKSNAVTIPLPGTYSLIR